MANTTKRYRASVTNVARINTLIFCERFKSESWEEGQARREVRDALLGDWGESWGSVTKDIPDLPLWEKMAEPFELTKAEWNKIADVCKSAVKTGQFTGSQVWALQDLHASAKDASEVKPEVPIPQNGARAEA